MSFKRNKLRDAIAFALVVGATATLSTGAAFAQAAAPAATTTDKKPATFETIVVTGTRIKSQTVTSSSPVTEINAEEFKYAGATKIDDLVNQYPQMNPYFDGVANNGSFGYPILDLRGIGPQRTLVLVDGNRLAQGISIFPDISIVPTLIVKRVDILTGGASAVYGSDAVAGVVNFILDTDFEGVKLSAGVNAYRHNNRNSYMAGKLAARGFADPTGDSGFDGVSKNVDIAIGGSFADGAGHAMAWLTWRQNQPLFQAQRDYSGCALNAAGIKCGGSATNAAGDFYFYQNNTGASSQGSLKADGSWLAAYGAPFNYAPLNYYQRPDTNYTFGASAKYEVNEHFKPFIQTMYSDRTSATELAPSGAFFVPVTLNCSSSLLGSACSDLGFSPAGGPVTVYVAKRNVEGGPRHTDTDISQFRVIAGAEGAINDNWSYNASVTYGRTNSTAVGRNDFLKTRIADALLGCPSGDPTCILYNVWVPGGVTAAAAHALQGTSFNSTTTELTGFNAFVTGDLPFSIPSADGDAVKLVVGTEWRHEAYNFTADNDSQAGNFAGAGGKALPLSGATSVKEFFLESAIPVYKGDGFMKSFGVDLGYRRSSYDLAGTANTYKIGFNADMGTFRVRGGYNKAIRAPNIAELFNPQSIGLFATTGDPCAGAAPTATLAQCQATGVTAAQYGHVAANIAGQLNTITGGNLHLTPEKATTRTLGFVVTPISNLQLSLDAYDIKLANAIGTVGAQNILDGCYGGVTSVCALIHRNAAGNLWRSDDGFVTDTNYNVGTIHVRGIDLGGSYSWEAFGGRMSTNFTGTYLQKYERNPLAPVTDALKYNCAGRVNAVCQNPKWRHVAELHYARDIYSVNLRWRYYGSTNYVSQFTGAALTTDKLLCDHALLASCLGNGKLPTANYFDLSGSVNIGEATELSFGVNNIADKEPPLVGNGEATNGNAPFAYDQLGRYFFANIEIKW